MPSQTDHNAVCQKALEATEYASDLVNHKLHALFVAIKEKAPRGSHVHDLAAVGVYLAADMGNLLDGQREETKRLIQDDLEDRFPDEHITSTVDEHKEESRHD